MHKINKAHQVRLMTLESSWRMVGLISCGGLALLILFMVMPVVTNRSSALDQAHWTEYGAVPSAIALSLDTKELETTITPTAGGVTAESTARLSINTQNAGFELYLSTLDSTTSMSSTNSDYEIKSITNPTASLSPNTWGYRMNDDTMYQPISLEPTLTNTLPAEFGSESTSLALHFGHNVDTALPAGQYTNTVVLSAIASSAKVQGLLGLNYMQDMTTNICNNTIGTDFSTEKDIHDSFIIKPGQEPTKQLIDLRDNKDYWVAKLADGNCWMTQNLALDLVKGKVLTPSDSDVTKGWTVPTSMENTPPVGSYAKSPADARSFYFGKYVYATPSLRKYCQSPTAHNDGSTIAPGETNFAHCANFQNVETGWDPTFVAGEGKWGGYSGYVSAETTTKTYDAHYLVGNYYQWGAATAQSGVAVVDQIVNAPDSLDGSKAIAPNSICPKGWQLPYANSAEIKSFKKLVSSYGWTQTNFWPITNNKGYEIVKEPFYFVYAGVIAGRKNTDNQDAGLWGGGSEFRLWSPNIVKAEALNAAYIFYSSTNFFNDTSREYYNESHSIRCIAR